MVDAVGTGPILNRGYRRKPQRRSYVLARLRRVAAITLTALRTVPVALIGIGALAWIWGEVSPETWALPFLAALSEAARSTRAYRRRGKRIRHQTFQTTRPVPPAVTAAVKDLAPILGLRARNLQVVVQPYGKGQLADLPLAAAAGWLGGGVLIIDDDLAAKADTSHPGDTTDDEVRAVVAHELAHIYALDSLSVTASAFSLAAVVTSIVTLGVADRFDTGTFTTSTLSSLAVTLLFGVAATVLLDRYTARACEYAADRRAAEVMGESDSLARALGEFGTAPRGWRAVLDQHPPTQKRLDRLRPVRPTRALWR